MTTIQDIAHLANVSSATVSRVINKNGYVSKSTKEKVKQAIQEQMERFLLQEQV